MQKFVGLRTKTKFYNTKFQVFSKVLSSSFNIKVLYGLDSKSRTKDQRIFEWKNKKSASANAIFRPKSSKISQLFKKNKRKRWRNWESGTIIIENADCEIKNLENCNESEDQRVQNLPFSLQNLFLLLNNKESCYILHLFNKSWGYF